MAIAQVDKDGFQIIRGTKDEICDIIEKLYKMYMLLRWDPVYTWTEEGDRIIYGYEVQCDGFTVRLQPQWWGTWICKLRKKNECAYDDPVLDASIHADCLLYPKVKTIQDYADKSVK
ncbi:MAG: hypothetical protein HYT12_01085 [Candidatus Liptonbacteria bacterium]|nr:hypothetical protein [Candidatus Liptonbacteria bacterium]